MMTSNIYDRNLLQGVEDCNLDAVKLAVSSGANINFIDALYRNTSVVLATRRGELDIVRYLIGQGADPDVKKGHESVLTMAASYNHLDIIKYVLENGIQDVNNRYRGALYYALLSLNGNVLEYLVSYNPEVGDTVRRVIRALLRFDNLDSLRKIISLPESELRFNLIEGVRDFVRKNPESSSDVISFFPELEEEFGSLVRATGFGLFS